MLQIGATLAPLAAALAVLLWVEFRRDLGARRLEIMTERITLVKSESAARMELIEVRIAALEKLEQARILGSIGHL